jgi:hypothetical protein
MIHLLSPSLLLHITRASSEMCKMMGAFRLNLFAMHSSSDIRPLEEEPVTLEFQVDLNGGQTDASKPLS